MNLHAGSLYENCLVLRGEASPYYIIEVNDTDLQWQIYCNDVQFTPIDQEFASVVLDGREYRFKYMVSDNLMETLGFN
jgi:hypothetical protein